MATQETNPKPSLTEEQQAANDALAASGDGEDIEKQDKPVYVKYTGRLVNGVILAAFNNREVFPGETLLVRGDRGIPYASAFSLVRNGQFAWCDENGCDLDEVPEPLESELEALALVDPGNARGDSTRAYPVADRTDPNYEGPVVGETDLQAAATPSAHQAQVIAQTEADAQEPNEKPTAPAIVAPDVPATPEASKPRAAIAPAPVPASTPAAPAREPITQSAPVAQNAPITQSEPVAKAD